MYMMDLMIGNKHKDEVNKQKTDKYLEKLVQQYI